jgi:hypothetical protein
LERKKEYYNTEIGDEHSADMYIIYNIQYPLHYLLDYLNRVHGGYI